MRKAELVRIWKQLDGCCEAIERLDYANIDIDTDKVDFSAIVSLKNDVEELILKKSKAKWVDLK